MPSFDVSSEMNWQEMDNAINQATKEVGQRFDFKGVKSEIKLDQKAKTITLWTSEEGKLDALNDVLQNKLIKRGTNMLMKSLKLNETDANKMLLKYGSVRKALAANPKP